MYQFLKLLAVTVLSFGIVFPTVAGATPLSGDDLDSLYTDSVYYDNSELAPSCVEAGDTATIDLEGKDNIAKAYNFFLGKGFSSQQAAGIVGNFLWESGLDPTVQQDGSTDAFPKPNIGFGIAQWTYPARQQALVAYSEQQGQPVTSFALQLNFAWKELKESYQDVISNVKAQSTVEDATLYFMGNENAGGSIHGFENPGDPHLEERIERAKTTLQNYGDGSSGGGSTDPNQPCSDGIGGLGINGSFVFPEKTTQAAIKNVTGTVPWCYQSQNNCHHDYAAADIFNTIGTTVVAAVSGEVLYTKDPGSCDGWRGVPHLQIKGEDGIFYYYTHMKPGSLKVHGGQKVNAGDDLGQIGPTECAQGTAPHLHFQMSKVMINNTESATERKQYINPQPNLVAAFAKLPES